MRERLLNGEFVHGLVIRAAIQTEGKGQRTHNWESLLGGSYQTLAVKDFTPPTLNKPYISLVMAIGLAEIFLHYGIQLDIKWPNDLYYKSRKVAGILCQYLKNHLLVGVGVNVNNEIPKGAIHLRGLSIEEVSKVVLEGLQYGVDLLARGISISNTFAPFDLLYGKKVSFYFKNEHMFGVARGVDENGFIKLETPKGQINLPYGHSVKF